MKITPKSCRVLHGNASVSYPLFVCFQTKTAYISVVIDVTLWPPHLWRHTHQNGLYISTCFQAEQRAAVIEQVELYITPTPDQLFVPFSIAPRLIHSRLDNIAVSILESHANIFGKGEISVPITTVKIVVKDPASTTSLVAMGQIEIFITPFLIFGILGRIMRVAGSLHRRMKFCRAHLIR